MKRNNYIIGLTIITSLTSCNDDFMNRFPETDITNETFFTNSKDLETYSNTFYEDIADPITDLLSDNISNYTDNIELQTLLTGNLSPATIDPWDWEKIRKYNFLLENAGRITTDLTDVNHFVGITKVFKALDYYDKVKKYNDVPWYSKALTVADTELLYKTQDSRVLVVDSIMADLAFAVQHIKEGESKTRITKAAALAIQARIALHEGTFRKYHGELKLNDSDKYLQIAVHACEKFINSGAYQLHTSYAELFNTSDLSKNREIILYRDYDISKEVFNNTKMVFDYSYGISQELVNSYLYINADKTVVPYTSIVDYDKNSYVETFKNRDARLSMTISYPGYIKGGESKPYLTTPDRGGYIQSKFAPTSIDQWAWANSYMDVSQIRLAEIYLIYAEAKAELGILTQVDLDNSVNKLRERVGLPYLNLMQANATVDSYMEKQYPNVLGVNKGVLLEIRRERRVELAAEGFRFDDVNRWKAGALFAAKQQGFYVPKLGPLDVTGDGFPDIAILAKPSDKELLPLEYQDKLAIYFLENDKGVKAVFYLSEGDHGHIMFEIQRSLKREFIEPKGYYWPMNQQDRIINSNLKETIFW